MYLTKSLLCKKNNLIISTSTWSQPLLSTGVGAATDSRQLLDSRVLSYLVVAYSRVRHTRVGRTVEYATPEKGVL